ncbi:MAG: DUF4405 domain-containing protein [Deltaproteobacteria bacterium]|nr:DUF4405 domain-containing protein [Deltaproteobacteria bacterium]
MRSLRALTSLSLVVTLLLMGGSGLVLWILPEGRVAYWTDWQLLGLDKHQWGDLHILSSWAMLAAMPLHLYLNWRPLVRHLRQRVDRAVQPRWELGLSLGLGLWLVASAVWGLPPLIWLSDLSELAAESWAEGGAAEPPFGHAEELPLVVVLERMDVPVDEALGALEAAGVPVPDPRLPLRDIGAAAGLTPAGAWAPVLPLVPVSPALSGPLTLDQVRAQLSGARLGLRPLRASCLALGGEEADCARRLRGAGLPDDLDRTLRAAADAAGMRPDLFAATMLGVE